MFNPSDFYFIGKPIEVSSTIIYSTSEGTVVPDSNEKYIEWVRINGVAKPWLTNKDGIITAKALDDWLVGYGLPPTGLSPVTKEELIAYTNEKQWALATGGYTVALTPVGESVPRLLLFYTDSESYNLITGKAARLLQPGAPLSVDWQFTPTEWVEISTADFLATAIKIADFMQATFDSAKPVIAGIITGTIMTKAEIDSSHWPNNVE